MSAALSNPSVTPTNGTLRSNAELQIAWEFVEHTDCSVFLTGKAGTGKTTFLHNVVKHTRKRCIVVAPTGVAAINAGGVTIHSFFQLPLSPYVPGVHWKSKFDFNGNKRRIIASLDLLIIDEISMVRCDLLDAIDDVMRRFRDHNKPFGGVQLLMIGDLAQLTPVVTSEEERLLRDHYDTPYFFSSKQLAALPYVTVTLNTVFRQQDEVFINILNHIRNGHPTTTDLQQLAACVRPGFATKAEEGYIRLTTHNRLADDFNNAQLNRLTSKAFHYTAKVKGTFPETSYPTAMTLELKKGTQVMFIKNDTSGQGRYYNGLIGQVTYLTEDEVWVKPQNDKDVIQVDLVEWENARYKLNAETHEIETDVQGTFCQYPLRLAWAVTIHKSQGLTFSHAVIDANQSFAPGQVYVALSRCRSLEGLVLTAPLEPRAIINDQRVNSYITVQETTAQTTIANLPLLKQEYERHLLQELFDFSAIAAAMHQFERTFIEFSTRKRWQACEMVKKTTEDMDKQIVLVSKKWENVICRKPISELRSEAFHNRVKESAKYFVTLLPTTVGKALELTKGIVFENKQGEKRHKLHRNDLEQGYRARHYLLTQIAEHGFTADFYLKQKQIGLLNAMDANPSNNTKKQRSKAIKPPKPKTWMITYEGFMQGYNVGEIANERDLSVNTIYTHLAHCVEEGLLSLDELVDEGKERILRLLLRGIDLSGSLSIVKDICPPEITWNDIKIVAAAMRYEQKQASHQ